MHQCATCSAELHPDRAELFTTCISCTPQGRNVGLLNMCNKTGAYVTVIRHTDSEGLRRASAVSNCVIRRRNVSV